MPFSSSQHATFSPASPLDYRPEPGVYDEMMLPNGTLRPHWQALGDFLAKNTSDDLESRTESIRHLLRDHGVTYNIYDDTPGSRRPWKLDSLPFIVADSEWQSIQAGLQQRCLLLNAILQDLYGPQKLLSDGLIPPRLVHANSGFLPPVRGVNPPGGQFLFTLGCDLVRDGDGQWRVLTDRAQAPSGHGYALENRIVMASVFAEEFHASRARHLIGYFDQQREMLRSLAPKLRHGAPGILMLTPGPYNETYFEHAFQARHLGFPLIEGADLTIRDRRAYLKTLEGLRRVDVTIRHVDDTYCDPLELQADSLLGTAGLLEAWRNGSVALVNGLGAGLIETPALHPFMPGLCRHLLGEELRLPCVPTWWCGQQRELEQVLAEPNRWVLKPAFARGAREPIFVADLDAASKARLLDSVRVAPHEWVAQEVLQLSTTPTWNGQKIVPRALVWRTFANISEDAFFCMPGGLARVSPEPHRWLITMRSGGISKDTWVLNSENAAPAPQPTPAPIILRPARPPSGVPSRAADHLFWLGRYAERLELTVRASRTLLQRLTGEQGDPRSLQTRACISLMTALHLLPTAAETIDTALQSLLQNPHHSSSIPDLLARLRHNASAARDRLSDDSWRLINRLERDAQLLNGPFRHSSALSLLDTLVLNLAAFAGMQQENMTHGHGWRFLEIGRRLERASTQLRLILAAIQQTDDSVLTPLLEIADSTMTYRRLHYTRPTLLPVLDLLLLNESNPRSVMYQLRVLANQTEQLPVIPGGHAGQKKQLCARLLDKLTALQLVATDNNNVSSASLSEACLQLLNGLKQLSERITEHYFSHANRKVG